MYTVVDFRILEYSLIVQSALNHVIHFILLERCKQIVDIARKHKLLIVCDDVYNLVYFTEKPPRRLYSYDTRFPLSAKILPYITSKD